MEVEISRRKFLQGTVAMSILGGAAVTSTNIFANSHSSTATEPGAITNKTG